MAITVTGTSYTNASQLIKSCLISQNYWAQMNDRFKVDAYYRLIPEPNNQYDKNAIRVEVWLIDQKRWAKIGYIPKETPRNQLSQLVNKSQIEGYVNIYKNLPNYSFVIK